jgi:hypothetical protein
MAATAVLTLALAGGPALAGVEPPLYHVTLLDDMVETVFPGVEYPSSWSTGLNENGDLVGHAMLNYDPDYGSKMRAFVYTVEHGVIALPLLPGWGSNAVFDVTDRDENGDIIIVGGGVIGPYLDLSIGEAALWRFSTVTGEVYETRGLGIPAGFDDSIAVAVNDSGIIVGFSSLTGPFTNWKYDIATATLQTFDFPARVKDLNNAGQVCGGVYRGDLFGNYEDLTDTYEEGDVMPAWAIDNGGISASWNQINDQGWLVGRAPTGISDGAGHYYVAIVRYADPVGWVGFNPVSHLSAAGGINYQGDFTDASGGVYFEDMGETYGLYQFIAPEWQPLLNVSESPRINDNRQVIGGDDHVWLLTPMGEMIIPGDVNGDVSVNLDDYCAWVVNPIDLNGDGVVDGADEQWLVERLLVFGFTVNDCNDNGACDHCDIMDGLSLDCDENDVPDECQPDCNADGVPNVCEPDCNANGTPDPCDIDQGNSEDCDNNGIPDECDEVGGVTDMAIIYDPPMFMYQDSTIVEDVLVVDAGIVDDVDLTLNYRYRIGYTKVELSHNGTTVTILDRPGHPLHYNGFVNFGYDPGIVDDDELGPYLEDTGDYCCNFESLVSPPSYRPNELLSAFDGMPIEGIWTFTMTTTPDFSSGDGLHAWGLTITRAAVEVPPCDPADLDGDGTVGILDFLLLLAGPWASSTSCCCWPRGGRAGTAATAPPTSTTTARLASPTS